MKNIILFAVTMALTVPAFAIHAYRSETCKSETHTLIYQGNYPVGGAYNLIPKNSTEGIELFEAEDDSVQENEFKITHSKIISSKTKKASCKSDDYDFDETHTKTQIVIELGKAGTNMIFDCKEVFSSPVKCK